MNPSLLTSVVIAAIVASLVSGVFSSLSLGIERRARRRELIFSKALELANSKVAFLKDIAAIQPGKRVYVADPVEYAEWYSGLLKHLHDEGRLPKAWRNDFPHEGRDQVG